jgi:hypothetical protein
VKESKPKIKTERTQSFEVRPSQWLEVLGEHRGNLEKALQTFYTQFKIPGKLLKISECPEQNRYAIRITYRRIKMGGGYGFVQESKLKAPPQFQSLIDMLSVRIEEPHFMSVTRALHQVQIIQAKDGIAFIFILTRGNATITRSLKSFSEWCQRELPDVRYIYSCTEEIKAPVRPGLLPRWRVKKITDATLITYPIESHLHKIPPELPFTQNLFQLEKIIQRLRAVLKGGPDYNLLNIFCGSGAMASGLTQNFNSITGIDFSASFREPFKYNAGTRDYKVFYRQCEMDIESLSKIINSLKEKNWNLLVGSRTDYILSGAQIRSICEIKPGNIARVYRSPDDLLKEVRFWRSNGYLIRKSIPFEWTEIPNDIRIIVHLAPDREEVLGKKKPLAKKVAPTKPIKKFQKKVQSTKPVFSQRTR